MRRLAVLFVFLFVASQGAHGQARELYFDIAEKAYNSKDYINAILYYLKTLDDTSRLESIVTPYETTITNLKNKVYTDTSKSAVTAKNNKNYDYIVHRLAHAYQHNFDYDNSTKYFAKCSDRHKYLDDT
jgi:hypothetical protein